MDSHLELWDYRRRVAAIYGAVRIGGAGEETWSRWTAARDDLFSTHPQTPIDDPSTFEGLAYFPYDERWRTVARFEPGRGETRGEFSEIGRLAFELAGESLTLPVFWLDAYGGGWFVPFGDLTNGSTTYGGGRYLLDTVKGADLGHEGDRVTLDFNYAYHPSCVHSYRWVCPLAAPESKLAVAVTAGEMLSGAGESNDGEGT